MLNSVCPVASTPGNEPTDFDRPHASNERKASPGEGEAVVCNCAPPVSDSNPPADGDQSEPDTLSMNKAIPLSQENLGNEKATTDADEDQAPDDEVTNHLDKPNESKDRFVGGEGHAIESVTNEFHDGNDRPDSQDDGEGGSEVGDEGEGQDGSEDKGQDGDEGKGQDGDEGKGQDGDEGEGQDGSEDKGQDGGEGDGQDGDEGGGEVGDEGKGQDGGEGDELMKHASSDASSSLAAENATINELHSHMRPVAEPKHGISGAQPIPPLVLQEAALIASVGASEPTKNDSLRKQGSDTD